MIEFVEAWAGRRPGVDCTADEYGNLVLTVDGERTAPPLWFTAHMDHPGFIVAADDGSVEFRGGVGDRYFADAGLHFFVEGDVVDADLIAFDHPAGTGTVSSAVALPAGTVGRWAFPDADLGVRDGMLHAPGMDDLAGVAAALSTLERTRKDPGLAHVGLLLTRAEEVGFAGAIGACKAGTIPDDARLIVLETSRAFPSWPIGAGPVVRVGDRISVFDPDLTAAISGVADSLERPTQRKLMDGGACEATAFCLYGYTASSICLPLGNYHNQGNLDEVDGGGGDAVPAPEFISLDDHEGLIELLVEVARGLDADGPDLRSRLEQRFEGLVGLLGHRAPPES